MDLFDQLLELQKAGHMDEAGDLIFGEFRKLLFKEQRFAECDSLLNTISIDKLSLELLLCVLTVTAYHKTVLPSRSAFYSGVRLLAKQLLTPADVEAALQGLA